MRCVPLLLLLAGGLQAGTMVFGKEVERQVPGVIFEAICEGYAEKYGLKPAEADLKALREKLGWNGDRRVDFAYPVLRALKLNRAWWGRHGGKLVLSAFGVHLATDAMLRELEGMEKRGEVKFDSEAVRKQFFWHYENYGGDGVVKGERARQILASEPGR